MRSFTMVRALFLCCLSWISFSVSQSQTLDVQPGGEVTLQCSNISQFPTQTEWFRLVNGPKVSCVTSLYQSDSEALFCDGFQNRFEMSSNVTTIFLKIKKVDLSDSGLYFCGFYKQSHTVIVSATQLNVQAGHNESNEEEDFDYENMSVGTTNLMQAIPGGLIVFLALIVLAVKITKLTKAATEELHPETNKNPGSDHLNPAALRLLSKTKTSEREVETHVVYSASR